MVTFNSLKQKPLYHERTVSYVTILMMFTTALPAKNDIDIILCLQLLSKTSTCTHHLQGGQSRGQHDWVHGFPEPVKSFITFVILSQISCGKLQKQICTRLSQSFSSVCCSFTDYIDQLKKKRKILREWVHTSVGRSTQENCSEPRRHFYTNLCRKI